MRLSAVIGILFIVVGVVGLAWGGFQFTTEEQVADVGPIEVESEQTERVPIPPIAGGVAVLAGLALVAYGSRKE